MDDLPIIAASARRHGITDADMAHAYRHPVRWFDLDDGFTLIIGTGAADDLLELGIVEGDIAAVIVHPMQARQQFLR